jgi:hypothetical protein
LHRELFRAKIRFEFGSRDATRLNMHCPRCGQQQVSEQTKFCNRCGFQMGLIPELLANNGTIPQLAELYKQNQGWFTRKNGVIFTALWFIAWCMMIPIFIAIAGGDEEVAVAMAFGFFTSVMLLIFSLGFLKKSQKTINIAALEAHQMQATALHGTTPGQHALPPQQSQPAHTYTAPQGAWRTPDTGEFAVPGSVTDSTTKLLTKDE